MNRNLQDAEKNDASILYREIRFQFDVSGDPLFDMEDRRWLSAQRQKYEQSQFSGHVNAVYSLGIDFANIKSLSYKIDQNSDSEANHPDELDITLIIQLDHPCSAQKKYFYTDYAMKALNVNTAKQFLCACRSPLNLGFTDENTFLNFWNLNQTFVIKGKTNTARFGLFMEVIKNRCIYAPIVDESNQSGIKLLEEERISLETRELINRGRRFMEQLEEYRLQLRYSIMALLSENKVSLFNISLKKLMNTIINKRWNQNETTACFASFLLDKMHSHLNQRSNPH